MTTIQRKPADWAIAMTIAAVVLLAIAGGSAGFSKVDAAIATGFRDIAGRTNREEALILTQFGSDPAALAIWFLASIPILFKRWWYEWLFLTLGLAGAHLLTPMLKELFDRPRPFVDQETPDYLGTSFPSGHAMMATVLYGGLALLLMPHLPRHWRPAAAIIAGAMIAAIALTRLYLGAHYFTDVLGGIAAGMLWLVMCELAVWLLMRRGRA